MLGPVQFVIWHCGHLADIDEMEKQDSSHLLRKITEDVKLPVSDLEGFMMSCDIDHRTFVRVYSALGRRAITTF
jgi:hypothetical protein